MTTCIVCDGAPAEPLSVLCSDPECLRLWREFCASHDSGAAPRRVIERLNLKWFCQSCQDWVISGNRVQHFVLMHGFLMDYPPCNEKPMSVEEYEDMIAEIEREREKERRAGIL